MAIRVLDILIIVVATGVVCSMAAMLGRRFLWVAIILCAVAIVARFHYGFNYPWVFLGKYLVTIAIPVVMAWAGNHLAAESTKSESEKQLWRGFFIVLTVLALGGSFWVLSNEEAEHTTERTEHKTELMNLRNGISADIKQNITTAFIDYNNSHPQHPITGEQFAVITNALSSTPKLTTPQLDWSKMARGLVEPEGAPSEGYDSESFKVEERFNRMSFSQIRALIADYIHRLQAFNGKWSYPPEEELDTPQTQGADEASQMAANRAYQDRVTVKRKLIEVVRPTKRATDFHKQFPNLAADVSYLGNRWSSEIHIPNDCFPAKTMQQDAAMACADYLKLLIEKYPRPQ